MIASKRNVSGRVKDLLICEYVIYKSAFLCCGKSRAYEGAFKIVLKHEAF
jgi:hypothetical protein